jgi:hypothetical protein
MSSAFLSSDRLSEGVLSDWLFWDCPLIAAISLKGPPVSKNEWETLWFHAVGPREKHCDSR